MWRTVVVLGVLAALLRAASYDSHPKEVTQPFIDPATGHGYIYVRRPYITWHSAAKLARQTWGSPSHVSYLAAINSKEEEEFLRKAFPECADAWIGGSDAEREGEWQWVTDPESHSPFWIKDVPSDHDRYSNWTKNEPNDQDGEDFAIWNYRAPGGGWNDSDSESRTYISGYLVEIARKNKLLADQP